MEIQKCMCSRVRILLAWFTSIFGFNSRAISSLRACANANKQLRRQVEENSQRLAELEELFLREKERSIHDSLTGLYNRHFLEETGTEIVSNIKRVGDSWAVLFIDIDNFKQVNDIYGHDAGNDVLIGVVSALNRHSRYGDFIIRNGGDEFIIILSSIENITDLHSLTERFRMAVEEEFKDPLDVTISMDCCFIAFDEKKNLMDAITAADIALYKAKEQGRNCVCVTVKK